MIKWLKCLFYGHDYGKFVGYIYSYSKDIFCPRICRYCKNCNKKYSFVLEDDDNSSDRVVGYENSIICEKRAQEAADKFNNSIE